MREQREKGKIGPVQTSTRSQDSQSFKARRALQLLTSFEADSREDTAVFQVSKNIIAFILILKSDKV